MKIKKNAYGRIVPFEKEKITKAMSGKRLRQWEARTTRPRWN